MTCRHLQTTDKSEGALPVLEPAVLYQVQVNVEYDQDSCIDRETLLEEIKANQEASQGTPIAIFQTV